MTKDNFSGGCSLILIVSEAGSLLFLLLHLYYRLSGLRASRDPSVTVAHFITECRVIDEHLCGLRLLPTIESSPWALFLLLRQYLKDA